MTRILLTGFEPFGAASINPSEQVVRVLEAEGVSGCELHTAILPVAAASAPQRLAALLTELQPDWCVMLGLADGRTAISVERVAVNLCDFGIPDNGGAQLVDTPIAPDGPDAYFASLPVRAITEAIRERGIPAELSLSAGAYLCNMAMYSALHTADRQALATRCGFLHLPATPEMAASARRPMATMALPTIVDGVRAVLATLVASCETVEALP